MSFKWEKGYKLHACRNVFIYCAYRKIGLQGTLDLLKFAWYDSNEREVQEYLKLYPITKEELSYEKELAAKLKKILKEPTKRNKAVLSA